MLMLAHGAITHVLGGWSIDPPTVTAVTAVVGVYINGWRPGADPRRRVWAFALGIVSVLVALLSPIHARADEYLSWHMVQHVVLIGVAGPMLAYAAPGRTLQRGIGRSSNAMIRRMRRRAGIGPWQLAGWRNPAARSLIFVTMFWGWHTARLYSLAVENAWVHALEHASFLFSAFLVWSSVLGPRRLSARADPIVPVLVVFLLAFQGVVLAALMTFSPQPWYPVYAEGLGSAALDDQRLAGVLMWVPLSVLYTLVGIRSAVAWLGDDQPPPGCRRTPKAIAPGRAGGGTVSGSVRRR